jgi:hypothetical protein
MVAREERGISSIVAEVMLIGITSAAMAMVAAVLISSSSTPERFVDLEIRLENFNPDGEPPTNTVKVIIAHMGGDSIPLPTGPGDEFNLIGFSSRELANNQQSWQDNQSKTTWENDVAWDNWSFSSGDSEDGFELGETIEGYLMDDSASVEIGDQIRISVYDTYAKKYAFREIITVENSA